MPVMGSFEFYKRICDEKGTLRYPVFVLTARGELKNLFKEIDTNGFMVKP
jgi:CheY-like chemotaxis protein